MVVRHPIADLPSAVATVAWLIRADGHSSVSAIAAASPTPRSADPTAATVRAVPITGATATRTLWTSSRVSPTSAAVPRFTAHAPGPAPVAASAAMRTMKYVRGSRPDRVPLCAVMSRTSLSIGISWMALWVMAISLHCRQWPPGGPVEDDGCRRVRRSRPLLLSCGGYLVETERTRHIGSAAVELGVEVDRGADQREVAEGLREVADLFAGRRDLLGVETEVVAVGQHLLEGEPRVVEAAGAGQGVDVPEAADREGALGAAQPVG